MPTGITSVIMTILLRSADTLAGTWYFVASGAILATLLSRALSERHWRAVSTLPGWLKIPSATILGMVSPVHTTSFVPFLADLSSRDRFLGPSLSFLAASSMMNPQLLVMVLGLLGSRFALAQLSAVFAIGVALGSAAPFLERRWSMVGKSIQDAKNGDYQTEYRSYLAQCLRMLEHVGLYYLVGVILGVSLELLLPRAPVLQLLESLPWLSVPLAGWLGVPLYVCGGGAVPLARSLTELGVSKGAMLAFLVSGQATRTTALANVGCLLRKKALVVYVVAIVGAAVLLGYASDLVTGLWGIA
jgi:uncharacterized membrane protein YraQ (UPF0718 family)